VWPTIRPSGPWLKLPPQVLRAATQEDRSISPNSVCVCATRWLARKPERGGEPSPPGGPVICIPMGNPARVKPQGTEIVGSPSALKGRALCSVRISLARRAQEPKPLFPLVSA